jgi:ribosomal protein S3
VVMFSQHNITIFARWLIRFMEKIRIKLHRRFLFLLKLYFKRLHVLHSKILNYIGLKLVIKGKIGSAGSSKKKIFKMSQGLCSLTKKNHKIAYCNRIVRTYTGALGLKLFLFY